MTLDQLCDWARSLDPLELAGKDLAPIPEKVAWPVFWCPVLQAWQPIDVRHGCGSTACGQSVRNAQDPRIVWPDSDLWLALHA